LYETSDPKIDVVNMFEEPGDTRPRLSLRLLTFLTSMKAVQSHRVSPGRHSHILQAIDHVADLVCLVINA
jgi:hypothetical protein